MAGIFLGMNISASALRAERARMNVHANNLANAFTTRNAEGEIDPYRRKRIFFQPGAPEMTGSEQLGVHVGEIDEDPSDLIYKWDPDHPDAIQEGEMAGYVAYPNVIVQLEMVDMMIAQRAYEANISAFETSKQVIRGALQIIA